MAYVGCIAGAIPIDEFRTGLEASGFDPIETIDTGADLNAYAKVERQSGCCSPAMESGLPVVSCCAPSLHGQLADLLPQHSINDYASSVRVYAVRPDK